jgi:hypothetical protein
MNNYKTGQLSDFYGSILHPAKIKTTAFIGKQIITTNTISDNIIL